MKVFILFKLKDPEKPRQGFIIDNIYTTKLGCVRKELKIHGFNKNLMHKNDDLFELISIRNQITRYKTVFKSETQSTYFINKSLKGQIDVKKLLIHGKL